MAHLPEKDESSAEDYSESFEFDDTDSKDLSSSLGRGLAELSAADLVEGAIQTSDMPTVKKPPTSKRPHSSGRLDMDLSRTIRSPIAMSEHLLHGSHLSTDGAKENQQPSPSPPPPLNSTARSLKFKEVAGKVRKLQSSAKKFKNSNEIREVAFKEWLAKKEVRDLRTRKYLECGKRMDSEKKRNSEVSQSVVIW